MKVDYKRQLELLDTVLMGDADAFVALGELRRMVLSAQRDWIADSWDSIAEQDLVRRGVKKSNKPEYATNINGGAYFAEMKERHMATARAESTRPPSDAELPEIQRPAGKRRAVDVTCPTCRVKPGRPCVQKDGSRRDGYHVPRRKASGTFGSRKPLRDPVGPGAS